MARRAKVLETLLGQVNQLAPNRSKASDGWIGDPDHQATDSDHNPNAQDIVLAQDITHDPANGADIQKIADAIIASNDPRIWYIIFNKRIWERGVGWKPYTGKAIYNDHTKHGHFNADHVSRLFDDGKKLTIGEEDMTLKPNDVAEIFRLWAGREPNENEVGDFTGKYLEDVTKYLRESDAGKQVAAYRDLGSRVVREKWYQNILDLRAELDKLKKSGGKVDENVLAKINKVKKEAQEALDAANEL